MSPAKQTICLSMIVRNECRIIERCLDSVIGLIDHWVIVDTGSTDGTQQLIRHCLRDVPGELIERPWINFAHNRSEALELAGGKSDYVLVIDADEVLVTNDDFVRPQLTHDAYYLQVRAGQVAFWRVHLFRNAPGWRYESPIHEYLAVPENATYDRLSGVLIESLRDGWRAAQPAVYQRDVEQLLRAHEQSPNDGRINFYLGQSYVATGEPELALKYYQQCVETSNWPEERWQALFLIAETKQQLQRDWPEVLAAYLEAYQLRPHRAEPLYRIATHYRWQSAFHLAHLFLKQAIEIPYPHEDFLFVEERLYRYLIKMALATCCYHVGEYEAGLRYCDELLHTPLVMPANIYEQVLINRQQCAAKVAESHATEPEQRLPVKVFVALHDSGPHIDNCVERLLSQTGVPFEGVFLNLGSTNDVQPQIPTADPRVTLVRIPERERIWSFVADHFDEYDVVLLLNDADWLASDDALAELQKCFADPGCLVTYGQFQFADGAAGLACRISDNESGRLLTDDWRCTYPLAVRGSLLQQVLQENPPAGGFTAEAHVLLAGKLFAAAGPAGVRFNSEPVCVHDPERNDFVQTEISAASISKNTLPTISCLTVTLNRLVFLKEAIQCYCKQAYPNKELVIVTDGTPRYRQSIRDYIRRLGRNDIRLVCTEAEGQILGALRNVSIDAATGSIMCQWDDDDFNHPQRLERQFAQLTEAKADACCFTDQLQFFFRDRMLFWSDWRTSNVLGTEHLIPGTLMAHRDGRFRYHETTEFAGRGEDSIMLELIATSGTVTPLQDAGFLNIYSYHGRNVFSEAHHRRIAVYGSQPTAFLRERELFLREALRHYRLPEPYRVASADGPVLFIQD